MLICVYLLFCNKPFQHGVLLHFAFLPSWLTTDELKFICYQVSKQFSFSWKPYFYAWPGLSSSTMENGYHISQLLILSVLQSALSHQYHFSQMWLMGCKFDTKPPVIMLYVCQLVLDLRNNKIVCCFLQKDLCMSVKGIHSSKLQVISFWMESL